MSNPHLPPRGPYRLGPAPGFVSGGGRGSPGARGPSGPQGPAGPDCAAASVVVDPSGGCDATTIQQGVDLLPAGGGTVFLRTGRYTLSSTVTLPNKPVRIVGDGRGAAIIDLGTGALNGFTIGAGVAAFTPIDFSNVTFEGDGVAGQNPVRCQAGVSLRMTDVNFTNVGLIVDATGAGPGVVLTRCFALTADQAFVGNTGATLEIDSCLLFLDGPTGIGTNGGCFIYDSQINSFATITVTLGTLSVVANTRFTNATITVGGAGAVRFEGMAMNAGQLNLQSDNNIVSGCLFESMTTGIELNAAAQRNNVVGCRFRAVTAPWTELAGADLNLFVANNGSSGSTVVGAASLAANNIA